MICKHVEPRLPAHPDTISGLAPDCMRELRAEYRVIQARLQLTGRASRVADTIEISRSWGTEFHRRTPGELRRAQREANKVTRMNRAEKIGAAIREYRRVAALWGVEVL